MHAFLTQIPDTCADPVMTHGRAPERVFPTELVTTDNAMLRKVSRH